MSNSNLKVGIQINADGKSAATEASQVAGKIKGIGDAADEANGRAAAGYTKTSQGVRSISEQLDRAQTAVLGFLGAQAGLAGAEKLAHLADEYNNLQARIKLAAGAGADYSAISEELFAIAQRTQQPLEAIGTLYGRTAQSLRAIGLSTEQTLQFTETLAQTFRISGAGAAEANAAIIQLSQGLASGVLRGDEFNSVAEQSPRLLQALADGLGVSRGELRQMAAQGELTAATVAKALQSQAKTIGAEYEQLPLTIGGAITKLENEVVRFVGQADAASGASKAAAGTISTLADHLDDLARIAELAAVGGLARVALALKAKAAAALDSVAASRAAAEAARQEAVANQALLESQATEAQKRRIALQAAAEQAGARNRAAQAALAEARANLELADAEISASVEALKAAASDTERAAAADRAAIAVERQAISEKALASAQSAGAVTAAESTAATAAATVARDAEAAATARATAATEADAAAKQASALTLKGVAGAVFNLNNALNLAIAAYAGYELGKVIFEQFESARKAGLALAEAAILTGEEIRYAFDFSKDAQKDHLKRLDDIEANLRATRQEAERTGYTFEDSGEKGAEAGHKTAEGFAGASAALSGATLSADDLYKSILKSGQGGQQAKVDFGELFEAIKVNSAESVTTAVKVLDRLSAEGKITGDELDKNLGDNIRKLATRDLVALGESAQRAMAQVDQSTEAGQGQFILLQDIVRQVREQELAKLGVDGDAALHKVSDAAKDTIATFSSLGSGASADIRLIDASFQAVLKKLNRPEELEALKASLKEVKNPAFDAADAIQQIDDKLKLLPPDADSAAARTEAAFKRMGLTATTELDRIAAQAQQDFDAVLKAGGSLVDQQAAFEKYAQAALKAAQSRGDYALQETEIALKNEAATQAQRAAVDQLTDSLKRQAREALDPLADAYKTLGLVSSATLKDQADAARKAYDALLAGNAPLHDQIAAYTAMAEKVLTAAKAQNSYALAQAEGALRAEARNQKEVDALQTIIQKLADANKNAKALGQSMDAVYEKTREARIEAESLANAKDRINNLGDVSASVVSLNGRSVTGFGTEGVNDTQRILDTVRGMVAQTAAVVAQLQAPIRSTFGASGSVAAAKAAISNAVEITNTLGSFKGPSDLQSQAQQAAAQLRSAVNAAQEAVSKFQSQAAPTPPATPTPVTPTPVPVTTPSQTIRLELAINGNAPIAGSFAPSDAQRLIDLLRAAQANAT